MSDEIKSGELIPANTPLQPAPVDPLSRLPRFRTVRQITRTVLQQLEGIPFAITFESGAYEGENLQTTRGGGLKMQPARLAEILNLETGERQLLIMNTVLERELLKAFPDNGYIGHSFIVRGKKPDGKGYRVYEIQEIELIMPDEAPAPSISAQNEVSSGEIPKALATTPASAVEPLANGDASHKGRKSVVPRAVL